MPGRQFQEKADRTLAFLMASFADVLASLGEVDCARNLPWREIWAPSPFPDDRAKLGSRDVQAFAIALQLLAMAEENAIAQARRDAEKTGRLRDDPGSWDQLFAQLGAAGWDAAAIAAALPEIRVEPVLTAHPTEAKRRTVLAHHRALYRLIVELENSMWTDAERAALEGEARSLIERMWRTGEIYLEKPKVSDERENILHYLTAVFPHVLPWVDRRLAAAWERAGFDTELRTARQARPRLAFGNWVGGDRDGHPLVDAQTTKDTLSIFRAEALGLQRAALGPLARALSLSASRQSSPESLLDWIEARRIAFGEAGAAAVARNPDEPFRQAVNLIAAALPPTDGTPDATRYGRAADYVADLTRLRNWLVEVGAGRLADSDVDPVIDRAECFGFHLAALDIRQNSAFHDRALAQLLAASGIPDAAGFADWPVARRTDLMQNELGRARPFAPPGTAIGKEADDVIALYRVLAEHVECHGTDGLGALIVSMTRGAGDLFAVFLFAREVGLLRHDAEGSWLPLPVVPLLETIEDLDRCEEVLDAFLAEGIVRRSLARQADRDGLDQPVQQVMIGYSDSGKDGGFISSFWALYRAQSRLVALGARHGVRIRFFHGRGGAIGRGAGPTHRFLAALPPDALGGDLRMTEQGETIAQKYANRVTAAHHLELLLAGALCATAISREDPPDLVAAMDILAAESHRAWRALVEAEAFLDFFAEATPIDLIEQSRHGSRPARRTGQRTLGDLRAIPWVFAWNQAGFLLPGWFGVGSALTALKERHPDLFAALARAKSAPTRWPPVHFLVSNAATAWARASTDRMRDYAGLVSDTGIARRFLDIALDEHARTGRMLAEIYGAPVARIRPAVQRRLELRQDALAPLHARQIELLRKWRCARAGGGTDDADRYLPELLLTVNAIAAGQGATG